MKGAIFKGIEQTLRSSLGDEKWLAIAKGAKVNHSFFFSSDDYPDEVLFEMLLAAKMESGVSEETLGIAFGKHWIAHTAPEVYPSLFFRAGDSAREFLCNMNRVHGLVTRNLEGSNPPRFEYNVTSSQSVVLHYVSKRRLCSVVKGIIIGVGQYFNEPLSITESACMHRGSPACTMEVKFI